MSAFLFVLGWVLIVLGWAVLCLGLVAALIIILEEEPRFAAWVALTACVLGGGLLVGGVFCHGAVGMGHGSETGYITAVQVKGGVWATPDLFFKTDPYNSETYQYCLPPGDIGLYDLAQELAKERVFVRVHYEERAWWHPWICNNGPMVASIEVLGR